MDKRRMCKVQVPESELEKAFASGFLRKARNGKVLDLSPFVIDALRRRNRR